GQPVGERLCDGGEADIGDHLDGERGAEHRPRLGPGEIEGEKTERDGHQPGAEKRDDLRGKEMPVGAVPERAKHDRPPVCRSVTPSAGGGGHWPRRTRPSRSVTGPAVSSQPRQSKKPAGAWESRSRARSAP